MARTVERLSPRRVATAKREGWFSDGGNLGLQVTCGRDGHIRKSWTFRYQINGRRREMGLGPTHTISLAQARDEARELRKQLLKDIDPLEAREAAKRAQLAEAARTVTFKRCAEMYLQLHQDGWRNAKHRWQWATTLRDYVFPVLGELTVGDIDQAAVMQVLAPIWKTKTVTAARIRGRIENILDFASASGFRSGDNPARHVAVALPKTSQIAQVQHLTAVPWQDIPVFMAELRARQSVPARCLEFLVLTAVRSGEVTGTKWNEIKDGVWIIPAERMKARKEHRVPLSARALEILDSLPRGGPYVFGGATPVLASMLLRGVLQRLRPGATVHGCRSAFRDWCAESTNFPREIAEQALAHTIGTAVERAYKRGDLFEKRRKLMAAWAEYCAKPATPAGVVTPIRRAV